MKFKFVKFRKYYKVLETYIVDTLASQSASMNFKETLFDVKNSK